MTKGTSFALVPFSRPAGDRHSNKTEDWLSCREVGSPRASLLELVGDLVDAGLGAGFILVAAGSAGDADGTNRFHADIDRQRAARRDHVAETQRAGIGGLGDVVGKLA